MEGAGMNETAEALILLVWDPHYLRLHLRGELQPARLLDLCLIHLDLAPFNRLVIDATRLEDFEPSSLQRLAEGLAGLAAAGADSFLLLASASDAQAMTLAGVTRAVSGWGTAEVELERWVRVGSARHAKAVAAVNRQAAEAPARWSLPSFTKGWLAG